MNQASDHTDDPYAAPVSEVFVETEIGNMPGIKRLPYFLLVISISLGSMIAGPPFAGLGSVVNLFVQLTLFAVILYLNAQRFINIGWSGWLTLLTIIPVVNYIVATIALACPPGYAITKQMDTPGWIIISLCVALMILGVAGYLWFVSQYAT